VISQMVSLCSIVTVLRLLDERNNSKLSICKSDDQVDIRESTVNDTFKGGKSDIDFALTLNDEYDVGSDVMSLDQNETSAFDM